jgi:hypothetical protein
VRADIMRSARRRWAGFLAGAAVLAVLFFYAGVVRTPGARKNPYMVLASRVFLAAGAFMLARIVLTSHEERTPVFLISAGGKEAGEQIALLAGRFEIVPVSDVLAFISDQRYVPPHGAGLVVEATGTSGLAAAAAALGRAVTERGAPAVLLVGADALKAMASGEARPEIPGQIDLAVKAGDWDEIRGAAEALAGAMGRPPRYAMAARGAPVSLKTAAAAGIEGFFGGDGFNRFGDRAGLVRLTPVDSILGAGHARGALLKVYVRMYRGSFVGYPLYLLLRAFGGGER